MAPSGSTALNDFRRRLAAVIAPPGEGQRKDPPVVEPERVPVPPFQLAPGRRVDAVVAAAAGRTWFHTFELVDATGATATIQGYDPTPKKAGLIGMPDTLDGQTVLDIGAYDGFFSFEAKRRGAADVLATDGECWSGHHVDPYGNFSMIRDATGLAVRDQLLRVEEVTPESVGGTFDVVLFFGVLYHAPDPLGYLRRVREVTSGQAIVETVVDLLHVDGPALAYYPGASLNNDGSNYFGPNPAAVEGLAIDAGFSRVEHVTTWQYHLIQDLRRDFVDHAHPKSARAVFRLWP